MDPCKVTIDGSRIKLAMSESSCSQACPDICAQPSASCTIPPLEPGTYTVEVAGEPPFTRRELVVAEQGADACALKPAEPPHLLQSDGYSVACRSDDDCRAVTVGDLCKPCACPNFAITASELDRYEANRRAVSSQCVSERIACAACPHVEPTCERAAGELDGTCKMPPR